MTRQHQSTVCCLNGLSKTFKNAADAANGKGNMAICIQSKADFLTIALHNGKGISKNNFKQIFDPGFTTNRGAGGRLSLSKRIIEEYHLGKLFVKSSSSLGTTFCISLHRR